LRINHVDLGLDNLEQLEIRDGLTESYLGLGDFEEADFQQEVQLRIVREEYPEDLQKLTAAMYKLGDWYRRSNQPEKETLHMQDSLRAIRKAAGDDSIEEITALRGLASAYQRLDMPSEALRVLKQAWRVNEKNPTTDILLGAEIEVELGDLYNAYGDTRNARRAYTGAWQTLTKANAADEVYERYFGSPTNIWRVELPDVYPSSSKTRKLFVEDPDQFRNGLVVAEFDIDENGRVKNILIVESDPPNLIDKKISYLLGRYFYRPRFANGVPVQTGGQRIRHNFSYLPQDKPTKKDKPLENGSSEGKLEYPGAGT
jgi:tetratricopeptide (TPR) repeat protein